jgi:hypothetical protein
MKKTLFVALMVIAGIAQAGEINLECRYEDKKTDGSPSTWGFAHKVTLNPETRSAVFGDLGIFTVTTAADKYILSRPGSSIAISREDLSMVDRSLIVSSILVSTGECVKAKPVKAQI